MGRLAAIPLNPEWARVRQQPHMHNQIALPNQLRGQQLFKVAHMSLFYAVGIYRQTCSCGCMLCSVTVRASVVSISMHDDEGQKAPIDNDACSANRSPLLIACQAPQQAPDAQQSVAHCKFLAQNNAKDN
jgi:hypothetical protein